MTHYEWRMTCGACPEAYDLYLGEEWVGYVRYRHGRLTAQSTATDDRPCVFARTLSEHDDGVLQEFQRRIFFPAIEAAIYNHRLRNRELGAPWEG